MTTQEIYIPVDSQKLADELKETCIKYSLPIWDNETAFSYYNNSDNYFEFNKEREFYCIVIGCHENKTQITKEQFIELLDNIKK